MRATLPVADVLKATISGRLYGVEAYRVEAAHERDNRDPADGLPPLDPDTARSGESGAEAEKSGAQVTLERRSHPRPLSEDSWPDTSRTWPDTPTLWPDTTAKDDLTVGREEFDALKQKVIAVQAASITCDAMHRNVASWHIRHDADIDALCELALALAELADPQDDSPSMWRQRGIIRDLAEKIKEAK